MLTGTKLLPSKLRELGIKNYQEYLNGNHWQSVRARYYESKQVTKVKDKVVCVRCLQSRPLSLHHRTYERLGNERLRDLILLCQECHTLTHKIERYLSVNLWNAHLVKIKKRKRVGLALLIAYLLFITLFIASRS